MTKAEEEAIELSLAQRGAIMRSEAVISVRLEACNEAAVRQAAQQMGVTLTRVKDREDSVQGYGTKIVMVENEPRTSK